MTKNHKGQTRKRKEKTETSSEGTSSQGRLSQHLDQARQVFDRIQKTFPRQLASAVKDSVTEDPRGLWQDFYRQDFLGLGRAATGGELSMKRRLFKPSALLSLPTDLKAPFSKFFRQVSSDLDQCPTPADRSVYVLKLATLFISGILSLSAAVNVASFGIGKNKLGKRPWIPSIALLLGARLVARLLDRALAHLPEDSEDRRLAEFLKANCEILAFGGSLGILEVPSFVESAVEDPSLHAIQQLLQDLFGVGDAAKAPIATA